MKYCKRFSSYKEIFREKKKRKAAVFMFQKFLAKSVYVLKSNEYKAERLTTVVNKWLKLS